MNITSYIYYFCTNMPAVMHIQTGLGPRELQHKSAHRVIHTDSRISMDAVNGLKAFPVDCLRVDIRRASAGFCTVWDPRALGTTGLDKDTAAIFSRQQGLSCGWAYEGTGV